MEVLGALKTAVAGVRFCSAGAGAPDSVTSRRVQNTKSVVHVRFLSILNTISGRYRLLGYLDTSKRRL